MHDQAKTPNKQAFYQDMQSWGFQRNSRDWRDYERAKAKLMYRQIEPSAFQKLLRFIADFLGL